LAVKRRKARNSLKRNFLKIERKSANDIASAVAPWSAGSGFAVPSNVNCVLMSQNEQIIPKIAA